MVPQAQSQENYNFKNIINGLMIFPVYSDVSTLTGIAAAGLVDTQKVKVVHITHASLTDALAKLIVPVDTENYLVSTGAPMEVGKILSSKFDSDAGRLTLFLDREFTGYSEANPVISQVRTRFSKFSIRNNHASGSVTGINNILVQAGETAIFGDGVSLLRPVVLDGSATATDAFATTNTVV